MTTNVIHVSDAQGSKDEVRIHRGTPWGNIYTHLKHSQFSVIQVPTRETAVLCHAVDLRDSRQDLLARIVPELKDKTLICYCHPFLCHGHTLAALADAEDMMSCLDELISSYTRMAEDARIK